MMRSLIYLLISLSFATPQFAHAIIDVRVLAGLDITSPSDLNDDLDDNNVNQIFVLPRMGAAAYIRPLPVGFGIGAQYDYRHIKENAAGGGTGNAELTVSTISLKSYFHFFELGFFVGPTASLGLSHSPKLILENDIGTKTYDEGKGFSTSLGLEAGIMFGPFMMGGEAGYQHYVIKSVKGPDGDLGYKLDLSGPYVFGFFGLVF